MELLDAAELHAVVVYLEDVDTQSVALEVGLGAVLGYFPEPRYDVAAEGVELVRGQHDTELLADLAERHDTWDKPLVVGYHLELSLIFLALVVVELADELLNEVGDGDDTRHTAVFIDYDREMVGALFLHLREESVRLHRLVDEVRLADGVSHDIVAALVVEAEIVLGIEYADDVVHALAAYREY